MKHIFPILMKNYFVKTNLCVKKIYAKLHENDNKKEELVLSEDVQSHAVSHNKCI